MSKVREITTNWSKGELSPLLEGHSDLSAYFEGAATLENFMMLRQGGVRRWYGSRFVCEVKDSTSDTILIPFEFSVDDVYVLEVGNQYIRIYKHKNQLSDNNGPIELTTPFAAADIRLIQFTQSADILFFFHNSYKQQRLNRVSDTSWTFTPFNANPAPSAEGDSHIGSSIALTANTGLGVTFRVGPSNLLAADAGRQIIIGAGRAIITAYTDTSSGTCDILDDFNQTIVAQVNTLTSVGAAVASTAHGGSPDDYVLLTSGPQSGQFRRISAVVDADNFTLDAAFTVNQTTQTWTRIVGTMDSDWGMRLSPQTTLDPNVNKPVGGQVTLVAGAPAFRASDVGRYIGIYGGSVKITARDSTTQVRGTLLSDMGDTTSANPPAAPAGSWSLEDVSWSDTAGWPGAAEFFQGRLYQASNKNFPTTFWGSASDGFDIYSKGVLSADALSYTIASRQVNKIVWLSEVNNKLAIGSTGTEMTAEGSGSNYALISGNNVPYIDKVDLNGCAQIQPIQASQRRLLYVDRSRRKIFSMGYDGQTDAITPQEMTVGAEHATAPAVRFGPLTFQRRLDPRLYFVREDGQLVAMNFSPDQKVMGFTRRTTQGTFQSVCAVPSTGGNDRVWVIVSRTINGVTKKYVEFFEDNHESLSGRLWPSLQLDCAIVVSGATGTSVPVPHLAGNKVGVVKNGVYLGEYQVQGDSITLVEDLEVDDILEIGLRYDSTCLSFRPAKPGAVLDGIPRTWATLFIRVDQSLGGKVNGEVLEYPTQTAIGNTLYTGDLKAYGSDWDTDGRINIVQDEPYPMTVLCAFGSLEFGEHD